MTNKDEKLRIILNGCNGKMGQMITSLIKSYDNALIVAGVDKFTENANPYPVFDNLKLLDVEADVIIDFSNSECIDALLDFIDNNAIPCVLCTTGLNEVQIKRVGQISQKIPMLRSANMSLGINLLLRLIKDAAYVLSANGFDMEIVEKHHNQKLDAPSGSALALADALNEAMDNNYEYIYDRSQRREKRQKNEIGISAVRGGSIVGDHDVIFAGLDEVITFSHTAYSRAVFGKGAIAAALFLSKATPGLYSMADVIGNI